MSLEVPPDDAPIGKQIDHVAKVLGTAARRVGFRRTGRRFNRVFLEGGRAVGAQCFNLQGSQYNEGSAGRFCINLGLWFSPIEVLWGELRQRTEKAPETLQPHQATVHFRLPSVVRDQPRQSWWPEDLEPDRDSWFSVGPGVDLERLAARLARLFEESVFPWLAARASVEAIALGLVPADSPHLRVLALVSLEQLAEARTAWAAALKTGAREWPPGLSAWLEARR